MRAAFALALVALAGCRAAPVACPDGTHRQDQACIPIEADAGHPSPPLAIDSGQISPPGPPSAGDCAPDDAAKWASAHRSQAFLDALHSCAIAPCPGDDCTYASCARDTLALTTCTACIARELDCLLRECPEKCGPNAAPYECVWCACAAGCGSSFNACAGEPALACTPCHDSETGCPQPLSPAVILAAVL